MNDPELHFAARKLLAAFFGFAVYLNAPHEVQSLRAASDPTVRSCIELSWPTSGKRSRWSLEEGYPGLVLPGVKIAIEDFPFSTIEGGRTIVKLCRHKLQQTQNICKLIFS